MSERNLPREPPTPEMYSRVTNPERFRPLHARGLALLDRLTVEYEVARTEAFALLPGMRPFEQAYPSVTLTPLVFEAAPVAIGFTTFPGLVVRYGRWLADSFPSCACDACGETDAGEWERLEHILGHVLAGSFWEELTLPWFGPAKLRWALGDTAMSPDHSGGGWQILTGAEARALGGGGAQRKQWQPWRRRIDVPAPAV